MAKIQTKILAFCGSFRSGSLNKKLLLIACDELKTQECEINYLELKSLELPVYNGDDEDALGLPAGAQKLIKALEEASAILIATPEYNGSIPGGLKNAIDWASRANKNPFKGKTIALIGTSSGWWGATRSITHLRASLTHLQAVVIPAQLALPNGQENIKDSKLTQDVHAKQLKAVCTELVHFSEAFKA
ncbi:MAG: NAD(P)H-dependent oxidoreductase [Oligoflexia bacterium]|nr:NAD(P)H-dependent oxidoreductase [Oligoflexia bacterium]